jgi:hydroxymethylpyrimidine pyrophosphatase-like HAD family hydrolase
LGSATRLIALNEKLPKRRLPRLTDSPSFGDYNNDLEMMALADYSFAMANSHPNILKAARYKTDGNDSFGVEKVLEKVLAGKV